MRASESWSGRVLGGEYGGRIGLLVVVVVCCCLEMEQRGQVLRTVRTLWKISMVME